MEALWIKTLQPDCTIDNPKLTLKAIRKTGLNIRMNLGKGRPKYTAGRDRRHPKSNFLLPN